MRAHTRRQLSLALLLATSLTLFLLWASTARSTTLQTTTFIDVGQGDAALLRDGEGFDVLIDGGKTSAGPTVLALLRTLGITELDVVIASHADAVFKAGLSFAI